LPTVRAILWLGILGLGNTAYAQTKREVALTFDDVPGVAM